MKNSPTIYQRYVAEALRAVPKDIVTVHYMDNIMLAQPDSSLLQGATSRLLKDLEELNLWIAPPQFSQPAPPMPFWILYF